MNEFCGCSFVSYDSFTGVAKYLSISKQVWSSEWKIMYANE